MRKYLLMFPVLFFIGNSAMAEMAPPKVMGSTTVDTMYAKNLLDKGITFVDVRSEADYKKGHIPGAKHLSVKDNFTSDTLSAIVKKDESVAFYCNGRMCMGSSNATKKALEWGWTKVFYFRDGYTGWTRAGLKVE